MTFQTQPKRGKRNSTDYSLSFQDPLRGERPENQKTEGVCMVWFEFSLFMRAFVFDGRPGRLINPPQRPVGKRTAKYETQSLTAVRFSETIPDMR